MILPVSSPLQRRMLLVALTSGLLAAAPAHADDKPVDYRREVLPIFAARCYQCHGPAKEESKFRLDIKERAYAGGESGQQAIVSGDPEKSQLIRFIRGDCEDKVMPAEGERLSEEQVDLLTRWVKEGAKWEEEKQYPVAKLDDSPKRIAAIVTVYHHNSHADVICSRLLQTYTLDGKGDSPRMKLASLFTDQVHENDISRKFAAQYGFPIHDSVADVLTLGTGQLAVDGVLLVAEHGKYTVSETGSTIYPKRRLFDEIIAVFKQSGRVVPLFIDKHLADNWQDAKYIYDTCQELKIPLMAGSSLPTLWRYPAKDVKQGAKLKEIVAVSYHTLDGYGFHALEMVQCLAEQRAGGETGIKQVQTLTGDAVWAAADKGVYDPKLLEAALGRLKRPPAKDRPLKEQVAETPVLWVIDYADGLRANVFTLNYVVGEWAAAWHDDAGATQSTLFYTQEARPLMHFSYLVQGIDQMMHSGEPAWPAERTLLTSGVQDALLISQQKGGEVLPTPHLDIAYQSKWRWVEPPPPPQDRPLEGQ